MKNSSTFYYFFLVNFIFKSVTLVRTIYGQGSFLISVVTPDYYFQKFCHGNKKSGNRKGTLFSEAFTKGEAQGPNGRWKSFHCFY